MTTAAAADVYYFLRRTLPDGTLIVPAGGYFRDLDHGVEPKDLDVFIHSPDPAGAQDALLQSGFVPLTPRPDYENAHVRLDFVLESTAYPTTVQVCHLRENPGDAMGVIGAFDVGLCQIAWCPVGAAVTTRGYGRDLLDRTLTLFLPQDAPQGRVVATAKRLLRLREKYPRHHIVDPDNFLARALVHAGAAA